MTVFERVAEVAAERGAAERIRGAARNRFGANVDVLRLAMALFILPSALFATKMGPLAGVPILAGCALAYFVLWRATPQRSDALLASPIDWKLFCTCGAAALGLCLLGGEAHIFYPNKDWLIRDAVLSDIVSNGYPLLYHYEGQDYLLRAPLGVYLAPAFFGQLAGLRSAHWALLAQNSALLTTILYFVGLLARQRAYLVLLLVLGFSGLDIVPTAVESVLRRIDEGVWPPIDHIEWWNQLVQYSSHITQLFWAPNHALPGWQLGVLVLLYGRREIDLATMLAVLAPLMFWSPLAAVGVTPIVALYCLETPRRELLQARGLQAIASGLLFLPLAYFITRGAGENSHSLLMAIDGYPPLYIIFLAVEIPHALILAAAWSKVEVCDRRPLLVALLVLALLPMFEFGQGNDLAMRASITPLFLLAFAFARLVAASLPLRRNWQSAGIATIVTLAIPTPGLEIARAFTPTFAISDCNFLTSWRKVSPKTNSANYLAKPDQIPDWLVAPVGPVLSLEDRRCWPDHPILHR